MIVRTAFDVLPSPARVHPATRAPFRVGLVQLEWHPDPHEHDDAIADTIRTAAHEGAHLVCLPELTRSAYFAVERRDPNHPQAEPEPLPGGPTYELVARCARETGTYVHASCYEAADDGGLGYNTAFVVAPDAPAVIAIHGTSADAVHPHPVPVMVTVAENAPPSARTGRFSRTLRAKCRRTSTSLNTPIRITTR